ncbi:MULTISPECIES: M50 family metallopeptidase [unclassified Nocardioides]|uniref:M50 family metallopeptidase n=1 Tax=unclassified Nocardioides TaxID=2615069 RepID=UPI0009F0487F|nr:MULTISPECIES: M50 family metallopeptidase [unclassified Nocardioides]GAW48421.1 Putative membrane protein [Nocardioides sp. PD653-B2]GAW53346.1 putative membrane protein [Nocardioides sp. PD653]
MTATDVLASIWDDVAGTQAPLDRGGVVVSAVVAALLVVCFWPLVRHVVTIAHEGAHGVAALLSGRRLSGIRLHSDTSGLTVSRGKPTGPGMVVTAFAGYVGPALLGLGAAYLLSRQHALAVLWLAVLLLALLLLQIRNFYGLYVVGVAGLAVFAVSWWGSGALQTLVAYAGAWLLLLAAPRPVVELQLQRRRGGARTSDADQLARLTRVPGTVWVLVFGAVTLACLVQGGRWLWAPA